MSMDKSDVFAASRAPEAGAVNEAMAVSQCDINRESMWPTDNPANIAQIQGNVNYQSLNLLNEIEDSSDF
jgi:hypothetical protein